MRLVDRALGMVGLARKTSVKRRAVYAAARINGQTQDWFATMLSADRAIKSDFRLLRERARQLGRDNPHITRYRGLQADNIIGPDGIRLQAMIKTPDGLQFDRDANRKIEAGWDEFCLPENASVDGLLSMTEIATLAVERWREDGEALIRMWPGFANRFAFSLQSLDADVLDHELNRAATDQENEIRMGVEVNQFGRPLAYWLWSSHPSDYFTADRRRIRVPAEEIIHIYTMNRPGQTRGITSYAPVMLSLNILGAYEEAELTAARVSASACFAITESEDADGGQEEDAPATAEVEMEPGMGLRLGAGQTVTMLDPKHPVQAFGTFVLNALRSVFSALHTAYSSGTGDLSQANYGSQRQGLFSERDGYKRAQRIIATKLYRRVYMRWLKYAITTGAVDLPMREVGRYLTHSAHRWLPRGFPWIDPLKDLQAAELELKNRLNTRANICAEDGRDYEEILAATADEEALADSYGVTLPDLSGAKPDTSTETPDETVKQPAGAADDEDDSDSAADDGARTRHPRGSARSGAEAARRRFSGWGGRRKAG